MISKTVLTGDRPTGPLHIGHYVGSLRTRLSLQHEYDRPFIMIADLQALTDNARNPRKVRDNVLEVAFDYLALGLGPKLNRFLIQSLVPELAELTVLYMNFVTLARLQRNPTVKEEMNQKKAEANLPVGFLAYPISQAADITAFGADLIPVGEDQLPMIEQTNEISRSINGLFGEAVLKECKPLLSSVPRLPGIDGAGKMGKSLGNAIYLGDPPEVICEKVMSMFTDPNHLRVEDPGNVEINTVFKYLDAFDPDADGLADLKVRYARGGLGDMALKKRLNGILQDVLQPIRLQRQEIATDPGEVMRMLKNGSEESRTVAAETLGRVRGFLALDY